MIRTIARITHLLTFLLPLTFVARVSASAPPYLPTDTAAFRNYSYVRFVSERDSVKLTDEEFFDIAGKVVFPINKYTLPRRDSLIMELEKEVFPLINKDSLELVHLIIRGATSPEGPYRFNKMLGEKRAETLFDFIKSHLLMPIDDDAFSMDFDPEDYRTLCLMMKRQSDKDYAYVQTICDKYIAAKNIARLKTELRNARQGTLWRRLFREYFPKLRAARLVFFFREPKTHVRKVIPELAEEQEALLGTDHIIEAEPVVIPPIIPDTLPAIQTDAVENRTEYRLPRREWLSVKTNLLFDVAYMPGYDRWCPIPNVAVEYYPTKGHFTFGASFDFPWWQHYDDHKYFQIRNYQIESRYYMKGSKPYHRYQANDPISDYEPNEAPAFSGLYFQAYAHAGLYSICFDADRGWEGEGFGGGVGVGYVMPISKDGHWRLEFNAQVGVFYTKYDPYQYEHPVYSEFKDNLYYYKWRLDPDLFKRRAHRFTWVGPTRVGVTLSYDILYRRMTKKGISFRPQEKIAE